jgi:deoxycytidine triphosphate deaminase
MMILSDQEILKEMEKGTIKIEPYHAHCLGTNSYDVHLGNAGYLCRCRTRRKKA